MCQTRKHTPILTPILLFSPEDEMRLAHRLGLFHAADYEQSFNSETYESSEQKCFGVNFVEEAATRQESEHVLHFEYLGLQHTR